MNCSPYLAIELRTEAQARADIAAGQDSRQWPDKTVPTFGTCRGCGDPLMTGYAGETGYCLPCRRSL